MTAKGKESREDRVKRHRALMKRAAAFRARQSKETDVVALVREGREDLERRGPFGRRD